MQRVAELDVTPRRPTRRSGSEPGADGRRRPTLREVAGGARTPAVRRPAVPQPVGAAAPPATTANHPATEAPAPRAAGLIFAAVMGQHRRAHRPGPDAGATTGNVADNG
jgi:hypothetical protein